MIRARLAAFAVLAVVAGCTRERAHPEEPAADVRAPLPTSATSIRGTPPAPPSSAPSSAASTTPDGAREGLRFVTPPEDLELAAFLRSARLKEKARGRLLVVYVGAPWCPPCKRFHAAAREGHLDAVAGRLTLVSLDADRDTERLAPLGYVFKNIPYFAVVGENGGPARAHAVVDVKPSAQDEISATLGAFQRDLAPAPR